MKPIDPEKLDDRQLVAAFLRHRQEGPFRELYRRYTPRLYQFALRLLAWHKQDAEEVVQETWIRFTENLAGFRWRSSLGTWLTGIVLNLCREHLRRRARPRPVAGADSVAGIHSTADQRLDLERAIAQLSEGQRQVLVLHDLEGNTHREISRLLDIKVGTSKSRLHQAHKALRERLQGVARK